VTPSTLAAATGRLSTNGDSVQRPAHARKARTIYLLIGEGKRRQLFDSRAICEFRALSRLFPRERRGENRFENIRREKADDRNCNAVAHQVIRLAVIVR
jgi:hypothetical protein